jgi:DNA primase small subunit
VIDSKEEEFLKKHFKEYYLKHVINSVPEIERREFGYGVYKRKIANRNIAFSGEREMNQFLREFTPLFFSYSNAYYSFPEKTPMQSKGLLKADIIYEFDADEISSSCKKVDEEWLCEKKFGEENFIKELEHKGETKQWFSKESLQETKQHVFRLIDMLEKEFAFSAEGIKINFSGKAGYHVHVRNEELQELNKRARIELVDYIVGKGIYYDNLGFETKNQLIIPRSNKGWNKRLKKGLKEFFKKDSKEISKITGFATTKINSMIRNNDVQKMFDSNFLPSISPRKNKEFWKKVLDFVTETYSVPIDRQTSIDLHKIIRVPNTLHGDTGLIAKEISLDELKDFSPEKETVVFNSSLIKVFVPLAPKFSLGEKEFGPFEEEEVEVPLYCAIFLLGKGAKLV